MSKGFTFNIKKELGRTLARAGVIQTPHGDIKTPAFIAVGTKATVKALTPDQIKHTGAQAVLANAYHLYLQPGHKIIENAGGLGKFMSWKGPTFTDSGGFQVLSLGVGFKKVLAMDVQNVSVSMAVAKKNERLAHVDDDGVVFKSHINGSMHNFTPESSMQVQHAIGADIIFAFDECTSIMQPYEYQKESLTRTHRWAERCLVEHAKLTSKNKNRPYQALYGVIQGAQYKDLRFQAARFMKNLPFDGYGIGGALEKENLGTIIKWVNEILPKNKPKHLLGLSEPEDIFIGIENGIDTFDCVAPARIARNGCIYTNLGKINIKNSKFKKDFSSVVEGCTCFTCQNFTKSYLHHLFKAKERLSSTLATIHNLHFIIRLVDEIRESIISNNFFEYKKNWLDKFRY